MHRHILLAVVLLAAALALQAPLDHAEQTRNAETQLLTVNAKQQLLSSTIQISMLMVDQKNGDGAGNAAYAWRGLGTLVEHDGSQFLLTHGHWPLPSPSLIAVELRDSTGKRLLLLDANAFLKLLRYHDRGTMLIEMSRQFSGVTPATLGNSLDVATGDIVWLAAYDPDAIGAIRIVRTHVEAVDLEAVPARLQLRGPHTAGIALGDSGGGVWADGKLVGNLWSIVATKKAGFCRVWNHCNTVSLSNQLVAATQPLSDYRQFRPRETEQVEFYYPKMRNSREATHSLLP